MGVLPRPAREAVARGLKADKVLAAADPEARRGYELRASQSEPGLEGGEPQKQLSDEDLERTTCTYSKPPSSAPARWAARSPR